MDQETLLRNRDFVRAVVRGVLRDEHLAEDAVQETWLAAVRSPPAKPGALRGWLARVGRNTALTFVRSEARRRAREAAAARPEAAPDATEMLARAQAVVEAVHALPEPYRTAVVERFLEGLSAEAVARRHGVTAATVRNRVREALRLLRGEIAARHGVAWPVLFAPLAAPSKPAAAAAIGGLVMVKGKLVAAVLLAAGIAVGWILPWGRRPEAPRSQEPVGAMATLAAERDRLRAHAEALEQRVAQLESARAADAAATPAPTGDATAGAAAGSGVPGGIDWARLEAAIARGKATLSRIGGDMDRESMRTLSPEDQAVLQELILEWNNAAAKARTVTPHPVLDARFFPRIVSTFVGGVTDLSPAQRDRMDRELVALLDALPDSRDLTPNEAYGLRQNVMAEAEARIDAILDAGQKEAWRGVAASWDALKEGNQRYLCMGLRSNGPDMGVRVLREFTYHYGLTEAQQAKATGIANRYAGQARELLGRFGQLGDDPPAPAPEARAQLRTALFELQLGFEKEILPMLDGDQRSRLGRQLPVILTFEDSGNMMIATKGDRGF